MKLETTVNSNQEIFILFDIVSRLLPLLLLESEALFPEYTTFVALETNRRPIQSLVFKEASHTDFARCTFLRKIQSTLS